MKTIGRLTWVVMVAVLSVGFGLRMNADAARTMTVPADLRSVFLETIEAENPYLPAFQDAKLIADDASTEDNFGQGVALDGDTALIGASYAELTSPTRTNAGAVYVFVRTGGVWTQQAKLTADDAAADDYFGFAVALEGDTALIGASYADLTLPTRANAGAVYVFTRTGTIWTQTAKLTADDAAADDYFGTSVALEGDTALIGAYLADLTAPTRGNAGAAYIFIRAGNIWTQTTKLTATDGAANDQFGYAVALDGNTALIGSYLVDLTSPTREDAGAAYVFTHNADVWSQQAKLIASDAAMHDSWGISVALEGDTALVGTPIADLTSPSVINAGAVYVFNRTGSIWTQGAKLTADDAKENDFVGFSVALEGDTALVGAYVADSPLYNAGAAYVFTGSGSVWTQQLTLTPDDAAFEDLFGASVALDGNTALVGAINVDLTAPLRTNAGAAYTFTVPSLPQNLLNNGDFSAPTGSANSNWGIFPDNTAFVNARNDGVFEFYATAPGSGVVQLSGDAVPANTGMEVQFDLGNSSVNRKRVTVIAWDSDFDDLRVCTFWLPANTSLQPHRMQFRTSQAWSNAQLSFYAATADSAGWYRLDNVTMRTNATVTDQVIRCFDPQTPAPGVGADSANFIGNSSFAGGTYPVAGVAFPNKWGVFTTPASSEADTLLNVSWQLTRGVFEYFKIARNDLPPATSQSAVILQNTTGIVAQNQPIEASFQLGNSSIDRARITVLVHRSDFQDLQVCSFWLEPETPLATFTIQTFTTLPWSDVSQQASISFYSSTAHSEGWLRIDNVRLRSRPTLDIEGTTCYPPGTTPAGESDLDTPVIAPTLLPTATALSYSAQNAPAELPLMVTPSASSEGLTNEGTFSE